LAPRATAAVAMVIPILSQFSLAGHVVPIRQA
jgi:hypothetical protein